MSLGHHNHNKFQRVSHLGFVTAPTSLNGGELNFARCLAICCAGTLCTFWGPLAPNRILPCAKFTLHPSLALSYIGSITAQHLSSGCHKLCGMVQGMELRNFRSSLFFNRGRHLCSDGIATAGDTRFIWWMQMECQVFTNHQTKPTHLGCNSTSGLLPSISTNIYYYYSAQKLTFYGSMKVERLSWPRRCSRGVQPLPKAEYHSGCNDQWHDFILGVKI